MAELRKVKRKRKLKELHEQKSKDQKRLGGRAGRFRTCMARKRSPCYLGKKT